MHNPSAPLLISKLLLFFLFYKPPDIFVFCHRSKLTTMKEQLIYAGANTIAKAQRPCRTSSMSKEADSPTVTCIVHRKPLWGPLLMGDSQLELTQRLVASCIRDNSGVSTPDQIFIQTGCVHSVIKSQQLIHIIKCSLKGEFINIIWRGNSAAEPRGETWAHLNERFAHVCRRRRDARRDKHSWPTLSNPTLLPRPVFRILNRDSVCWR